MWFQRGLGCRIFLQMQKRGEAVRDRGWTKSWKSAWFYYPNKLITVDSFLLGVIINTNERQIFVRTKVWHSDGALVFWTHFHFSGEICSLTLLLQALLLSDAMAASTLLATKSLVPGCHWAASECVGGAIVLVSLCLRTARGRNDAEIVWIWQVGGGALTADAPDFLWQQQKLKVFAVAIREFS